MSDQDKGPESPSAKEPNAPLDAYMDLWAAIERSGLVLSGCIVCGQPTVCIPVFSGVNKCRSCWEGKGK